VTNLLCCCCAIPLGLGTVDRLKPYLSESAMLSGCITGILTLTAYGIGVKWIPGDASKSFALGADFAWRARTGRRRALECHCLRPSTPRPVLPRAAGRRAPPPSPSSAPSKPALARAAAAAAAAGTATATCGTTSWWPPASPWWAS